MPSACWRMCARMSVLLRPSIAVERKQRQNWCGHDRVSRPPRKKSADLGSSRCEVDIKRVYDAVIRPGNLSNAGLILPTCRLFRLSFTRISEAVHLKPCHIDSQRTVIRIEQGKGQKDRLWAAAHT